MEPRAARLRRVLRRALRGFNVLRVAMAVILLAAAGLKSYKQITEPALKAGFFDSRWFVIWVVELELLFAVWLLSLHPLRSGNGTADNTTSSLPLVPCPSTEGRERVISARGEDFWAWLASICLFSMFGCISLWNAIAGETTCGCFGRLDVSPWLTTAMDLAFVAALIRFRPQLLRSKRLLPAFGLQRVGSILLIWAVVGGPVGFAVACFHPTTLSNVGSLIGEGNLVVLEPEKWVGKRFPLLNYIDIGEQLAAGEWTVVFFRSGCPNCQAVLRAYKERATQTVLRRESHWSRFRPTAIPARPPTYSGQRSCPAASAARKNGSLRRLFN